MRKLNLGCGPYKMEGHINIDCNPLHKPDIVRDVSRGLPFDDNSVESIVASHFLESFDTFFRPETSDYFQTKFAWSEVSRELRTTVEDLSCIS